MMPMDPHAPPSPPTPTPKPEPSQPPPDDKIMTGRRAFFGQAAAVVAGAAGLALFGRPDPADAAASTSWGYGRTVATTRTGRKVTVARKSGSRGVPVRLYYSLAGENYKRHWATHWSLSKTTYQISANKAIDAVYIRRGLGNRRGDWRWVSQ